MKKYLFRQKTSVVDPDLVGSESFSRIRIRKKSFRIQAAQDLKWIWSKTTSEKLINGQFLTKNAQLKNINSFFKKNFPKKIISRHNVQPNKGKIYVKIRKISCRILKKQSGSTTLKEGHKRCLRTYKSLNFFFTCQFLSLESGSRRAKSVWIHVDPNPQHHLIYFSICYLF